MPVIRILSWNLWHGLDPYGGLVMSPMESPSARIHRYLEQERFLQNWKKGPTDFICLQEVNPLEVRLTHLKKKLSLVGEGALVNTGVKLGKWGLPPGLQEGLGILWDPSIKFSQFQECTLSGNARELSILGGLKGVLQFSERRKAILLEFEIEGRRIALINLHLHHGSVSNSRDLMRKKEELSVLFDWFKPRINGLDFLIICGDFNSELDPEIFGPLAHLGLIDAAERAGVSPAPTWDPRHNPLAALSGLKAKDPQAKAWDIEQHVLDHILIASPEGAKFQVHYRQYREPGMSDHFAVEAEIEL